jgi:hypothetical protein
VEDHGEKKGPTVNISWAEFEHPGGATSEPDGV